MKNQNHASRIYTALIFIILYAPLAVLIVFSFNSANSTSVFGHFSFKWYGELFKDAATITSLKNTMILAVVSSAISTVVGTAASVGIYKIRKKWVRSSIMTTTNIPMMNPDIVTGISMMLLFVFVGTLFGAKGVLGFKTLLMAHITFELPYIVLSVIPRLRQMDKYLTEAAEDLGCTPTKAFFKVTLPYIKPGIVTGFIMAFTLSLDDFVISYFCSGPEFQTLPIRIYSMTKKRVTPDMYALSTIIFIVILILLLLSNTSKTRTAKVKEGNA